MSTSHCAAALPASLVASPGTPIAVSLGASHAATQGGCPAGAPRLEARDLTLAYGRREVVRAVSLTVEAGQWWAVVGPNGAGKSSLLRMLAGLQAPAHGEVRLQGRGLPQWRDRERARQLAWLGQSPADAGVDRLKDTVMLGRWPHQEGWGAPSPHDHEVVAQALALADLSHLADRDMSALSGGERQRAHLARALAVQAPVLLLDEPTTHLDAPHVRKLAQVLNGCRERGGSVVSVLHDLNLALQADHLLVMADGRAVCQGHRDDPVIHRALTDVFDGAVKVVRHDGQWQAWPVFAP